MRLHILTPVSRRDMLGPLTESVSLAQSVARRHGPDVDLQWNILFDDRRQHPGGWGLRNRMLNGTLDDSRDWCHLLDDDTVMHPLLLRWFVSAARDDLDMLLFAQTRPDEWDPGCADPVKLRHGKDVKPGDCAFDAGQVFFRRNVVGSYRFVEGDHDSDGYFWRDVLAQVPLERIGWTDQVLGFYNALRPV